MVIVHLDLSEGRTTVSKKLQKEKEREKERKDVLIFRIATIRRTWRDMTHAWRPYVFFGT